jgi:hypothetical protein
LPGKEEVEGSHGMVILVQEMVDLLKPMRPAPGGSKPHVH